MKTKVALTLFAILSLFLAGSSRGAPQADVNALALGTAITYQGRLADGGGPANGTYDFRFTLYNAGIGGAPVGSLVSVGDVPVSDGYFTVQLDFGAGAFGSDKRWLEVAVRPGASSGGYTVLTPRQALTPAPLALYAQSAGSVPWGGVTGIPAGYLLPQGCAAGLIPKSDGTGWLCGSDNNTTYTAGTGLILSSGQFSLGATYTLPQGCTTNQVPKWNGSLWTCAADNNTTTFWSLTGNAGTNPASNYLGTSDNKAFEIRVNGQRSLRMEPNGTSPNVIAGYSGNTVTAGVFGAVIGGGGDSTDINKVSGNNGVVSGGTGNYANAPEATIAGGYKNTVTGDFASIGGGSGNAASGSYAVIGGGGGISFGPVPNQATGDWSTVAGGRSNTASGPAATVGGGDGNTASSVTDTVPGGSENTASGGYSFAAGAQASATQIGSFVWSSSDATTSWGDFTFTARAPGGVRFYTGSGTGTGVQLAAGGGSFASLSDRNAKFNFSPVNNQQVLEKIAALPISTWSYRSQDDSILHMGPMAQDFSAAFGLGEDEHYIGTLDSEGVALAAIQGLYQLNQQQAAEIRSLKAQLSQMKTTDSPHTSSSLPLTWVVIGLLAISQVGMFLALRRKMGGKS